MSIAQQLYHLQETDIEIESAKASLQRLTGQIGESPVVVKLRAELEGTTKTLEQQRQQQKSLEWDDEDISVKLKKAEKELYSGRIRNPKELSSLQQDIAMLKQNRGTIDDKLLALMDRTDLLVKHQSEISSEFRDLENHWQAEQKQLNLEIEKTKESLAKLEQERQALTAALEPDAFALYQDIKKKRKTAVARVTQGTCSGCHIQLTVTDLQKARSGNLIQCSSCGRILYL